MCVYRIFEKVVINVESTAVPPFSYKRQKKKKHP